MARNSTYSIKRDWLMLSIIVLFILSIAYLTFVWFKTSIYVPREFFEARGKGAAISEAIVRLAFESADNLKEITILEKGKNYSEGLDRVLQEIARNEEAREQALALSAELERMATSISDVRPDKASDTALQAVILQSQIVQRLINYNNYLGQLLNALRSRLADGAKSDGGSIASIIEAMNSEISSINTLNEQYKNLMAEFDKLTNIGGRK